MRKVYLKVIISDTPNGENEKNTFNILRAYGEGEFPITSEKIMECCGLYIPILLRKFNESLKQDKMADTHEPAPISIDVKQKRFIDALSNLNESIKFHNRQGLAESEKEFSALIELQDDVIKHARKLKDLYRII